MFKINLTFTPFCDIIYRHRDVAQLVARLVWDQDVAGSNPVIPIKNKNARPGIFIFCFETGFEGER